MSNDQQLVCPICSSGAPQVLKERRWEYKIYQCTECGVEYASPLKSVPIDDPRIKKCYQRRLELAGDYLGWAHREFSKTKILKRDSKILEIGCGTGDFINFLNERLQTRGLSRATPNEVLRFLKTYVDSRES